MNDSAAMCGKAFANVVDALKPNAYFPDNVFKAPWYNFLFFDAKAAKFLGLLPGLSRSSLRRNTQT